MLKIKLNESNGIRNLFEARGAYNSERFFAKKLYDSIYVGEILYKESVLNEEDLSALDSKERGGIITFSTVMNSTVLSSNRVINFLKQKMVSLKNRILAMSKIDSAADKFNLMGWTVTKGLHGRYKDRKTGHFFDENSISVELVGIDNDTLIAFAKELCREFQQQSVLVKSYSTQDIWFVENPDGI